MIKVGVLADSKCDCICILIHSINLIVANLINMIVPDFCKNKNKNCLLKKRSDTELIIEWSWKCNIV